MREQTAESEAAFRDALGAYYDAERPPLCPQCGGWDGPRLPFCTDEGWAHHETCRRYTFALNECSECAIPPA